MFEQTFVESSGKTDKPWTTMVGFILQAIVIGVAVLVPMIWTDVLPAGQLKSLLVAPPPPPPPPPPAETPKVVPVKVIPRQFDAGRLMAPKAVPTQIAMIKEEELPPPSAGGGAVGGTGSVASGVLSGILGAAPAPVIAPPPPKVEAPKIVQRIQVGGRVQEASLIKKVQPVYPPLARSARIQGHVILNAVISKDGTIQELKLASGHPMLAPAAMEAVKQWVYKPTLLNGEPVEVTTEIDVNFTLQ